MLPGFRIILIEPSDALRTVLAKRMRAQGYQVEEAKDPAQGAESALSTPPSAVIAALWMPGISGVQLCRLLRSEPATMDVPVILCGDTDEPRNRFWADRAGALAYVSHERTGDIVRALGRAVFEAEVTETFFFQVGSGAGDIRDRIARQLDTALFDSVIAAEVRALATSEDFQRLFDRFVQFFSQVARYRWAALLAYHPEEIAVHHRPGQAEAVDHEVRSVFRWTGANPVVRIEDDDAAELHGTTTPIVLDVPFGNEIIGRLAVGITTNADFDAATQLVSLIARELGGPMKMAALVQESQRRAATDSLTGLQNRRAFSEAMEREIARTDRYGHALSLVLFDIDHFKKINDQFGHNAGDRVLTAIGALLRTGQLRQTDIGARWGGEEFIVAYLSTPTDGAQIAAERLREAVSLLVVADEHGVRIPVTASFGIASSDGSEPLSALVHRADVAMYRSKAAGRNRVTVAEAPGLRKSRPAQTRRSFPAPEPNVNGSETEENANATR